MNHRLALLSAILANPDDDLPRLVFADWLEENGTTDADAARVEFIRLGCKSKAKSRMSPAEGKWLDANWRRLLGQTLAGLHPNSLVELPAVKRDGRFLRLRFRWNEPVRVRVGELSFEYSRGFARRVQYQQTRAYDYFWRPAASDEPLAYHRPELVPELQLSDARPDAPRTTCRLLSTTWGDAVYQRVIGHDEAVTSGAVHFKVFRYGRGDKSVLHPLAAADDPYCKFPNNRQRAAVATAMTAIAREFVGLDPAL